MSTLLSTKYAINGVRMEKTVPIKGTEISIILFEGGIADTLNIFWQTFELHLQ